MFVGKIFNEMEMMNEKVFYIVLNESVTCENLNFIDSVEKLKRISKFSMNDEMNDGP